MNLWQDVPSKTQVKEWPQVVTSKLKPALANDSEPMLKRVRPKEGVTARYSRQQTLLGFNLLVWDWRVTDAGQDRNRSLKP